MFSTSSRIFAGSRSFTYLCCTSSRTSTSRRKFSCLVCSVPSREGALWEIDNPSKVTAEIPSSQARFQRDMLTQSSWDNAVARRSARPGIGTADRTPRPRGQTPHEEIIASDCDAREARNEQERGWRSEDGGRHSRL